VKPHVFVGDPDTPADPISGKAVCAHCHRVGRADDVHHTMPDPAPDAQTRAAGDN
jgi:hypothetical protein